MLLNNKKLMLPTFERKHLYFILFLLFNSLSIFAQDNQSKLPQTIQKEITSSPKTDTLETGSSKTKKSPVGAIWRSFVLPGWGQIYVENYWKAPIFIAGVGASVYFIIWNNNKYQSYQNQYDELKKSEPDNAYGLERLKSQKEYYRDNRDKSYFLLGVTYILAAVDAYVGAHLFDFNVDDNLSIRLMPYYSEQFGLNMSFIVK